MVTTIEKIKDGEFIACDACGHRSASVASSPDRELTFCGHHGAKFVDKLTIQGYTVEFGA